MEDVCAQICIHAYKLVKHFTVQSKLLPVPIKISKSNRVQNEYLINIVISVNQMTPKL